MQPSVKYTIFFAAVVCFACSILVSTAAVVLKDKQDINKVIDQQMKVLTVSGLVKQGESVPAAEVTRLFEENLEPVLIDMDTGDVVTGQDPVAYDQRKASRDPARSRVAEPNPAKVRRVPEVGKIYLKKGAEGVEAIILPVEGMGLWSTLYGYVALSGDTETIKGLIFYEHGETPGLGGEVDNPNWKALWPGRKPFDEDGDVVIKVNKGSAGPVETDPHRVDGLAGATLTANGVTHLLHYWLGDRGFGPYLDKVRAERGNS